MTHVESGQPRSDGGRAGDGRSPVAFGSVQGHTDLLAVIAHELRQPLAAAMLATDFVAELLESGASAAFVREYLDLARRGVRQSLRMTHDFVTLGQVGARTLQLRPATVDVGALLAEARALSELQARAKRVDVHIVVERPLPSLVADADRLLQVLTNLCGNAVRFTPPGGRVTLSATAEASTAEASAGAPVVRIAVRDTGPGVPAADLGRIFEPYWQSGATPAGAGLGLAVARWIVEAHGGRIAAHRAPGGGLTVAFTMPCGPTDAGHTDETSRPVRECARP
jgi:signal transduction histidine kinase